jgi:phosphoglycerate dehydrogenase-like enzyme
LTCGVRFFSAWQANSVPVAEVASAEILLSLKGFFQREVKQRSEWNNSDPENGYPGCYKANVGIIGAGSIGKSVISKLRSTDINIKVFDAFLSKEQIEDLGAEKVSLEELFSTCDVISNHLANVPATVGMLDHNCFDKMKKYATFINTGRGAQIVEADLIKAMEDCPTRMALLDVTDPCEPPLETSKLYSLPNIRLTPHIAGSIGNEVQRMAQYMYEEFNAYKNGEKTRFEVTIKMLPTMA